ncbi:MAG: F0F1 ATP synthase subunit B [Kiritimatiellae bacterium]|nr:F0F1 ATP synthase subunit B [Kiritimatiellia bacterium]
MAETSQEQAIGTIEQPTPYENEEAQAGFLKVSAPMMGLTWLTFGILAFVLYKIAWKPVLSALDNREKQISAALDEAEKTREAYAEIEQQRQKLIDEADAKAREIVEQARKAAIESAQIIEAKARDEAGIMLANAEREITTAHAAALADLRRESADLAISLSRKILADQIDEPRSRDIVKRILEKV